MSGLDNGTDAQVVDNEAPQTASAPPIAETLENGTQAEGEANQETAVERTYSKKELQESVERATAKTAAKTERRLERQFREELLSRGLGQQAAPAQQEADGKPSRAQYGDDEGYLDALTDWKLEQRDRANNQQRAQVEHQTLAKKTEAMYAEAEKQPGFDRDVFNDLNLTRTIATALTESDIAPKLMVYMAANPDDVERIAKLSPVKQAAEIGKLEVRLSTATASKAATPITPVGSRGNVAMDPERMTQEQYEKWRAGHRR